MIRGPFSHEPGRLECVLLGMQGLGGPGRSSVPDNLLRYAPGRRPEEHPLLQPGAERAAEDTLPHDHRRLGKTAYSQDP